MNAEGMVLEGSGRRGLQDTGEQVFGTASEQGLASPVRPFGSWNPGQGAGKFLTQSCCVQRTWLARLPSAPEGEVSLRPSVTPDSARNDTFESAISFTRHSDPEELV